MTHQTFLLYKMVYYIINNVDNQIFLGKNKFIYLETTNFIIIN